jgi:hypothetical protein
VVGPLLTNEPAKLIELGAVAVKPPLKVKASAAASPRVSDPVFAKVTAFVNELIAPVIARPKDPDPEVRLVKLILSTNETFPD